MTRIRISLLIATSGILAGCGSPVSGSGHLQTQSPSVAGVKIVNLRGVGELHIVQGPSESLNVTTDDNLLPLLETSVQGEVLTLSQKPDVNLKPSHSIVYQLCVKEVKSIELSGTGSVDMTGVKGADLKLVASGAGDFHLNQVHLGQLTVTLSGAVSVTATGEASRQAVQSSGVGNFDGKALAGETVTVSISGAGAAVVNASKTLDAQLSGVGSVTYFGKPTVTQKISGVGTVSPG